MQTLLVTGGVGFIGSTFCLSRIPLPEPRSPFPFNLSPLTFNLSPTKAAIGTFARGLHGKPLPIYGDGQNDPEASLPFVREILTTLRQEVDGQATVLGFVGAPWTLAAYAIEGKSSKDYSIMKSMAFSESTMLHQFLGKLADAIAVYVRYQIDAGAQVVQLFDSWAGQLSPEDFKTFALPYQQRVVEQVKATHPDTPLILYINGSAGILELMVHSGVDVVSVDWTVDMTVARQRLGANIGVQGNLDPCVLFGSKAFIRDRILDTMRKAGNQSPCRTIRIGSALILAVAGLQRLGMGDRIHQVLPAEVSLYAVGHL